jgi:pimeloyl-ACP methyl ester carboxylesterase
MQDPCVAALGARLSSIAQPTSIIWGGRDPWLDLRLAERLRGAISGATLDVIPDAGHFSPEDAPARVAAGIAALLTR